MRTLVGAILSLCLGCAGAEPVTTRSLIEETVDLERLGTFPSPSFRTVQFSSYDRRSVEPGGTEWFANSDGFGKEPIPNFESVLDAPGADGVGRYLICDVTGAGAIVRTWTARIGGTLRVYLDGADAALYDGPAEAFLLRPYDAFAGPAGLEPETLDGALYQRNAAYCPIPFARRCRIEWTGKIEELHFYEVQMRLYEENAEVETFAAADLAEHKHLIRDVCRTLKGPDTAWTYGEGQPLPAIDVTLAPGETKDGLVVVAPGALQMLELRVEAEDAVAALRQTMLHIRFDGAPWGQVQSPVGDFFGAAPGVNPFDSVPFTVRPDGTMVCRYVMPFEREAAIVFENKGGQPVRIVGEAKHLDRPWDPAASMHFRARWRVDHDLLGSDGAVQGVQDLPFLMAFGKGVYVGTTSLLMNPNPIPSPGGNWWGEGDEKIFVDGDERPSTFGTGSEDYYNYAWSAPDIFLHPYCGQPRNDGPANRGFVTNFRWHILDPLPFESRFAFYMELFTHEPTPGMTYARIAYHYGIPGVIDDHVAATAADVRRPELPADWSPAARGAARHSVFVQAEQAVAGDVPVRFDQDPMWAERQCMVWTPAAAGDTLALAFDIEEEGSYRIKSVMRFSGDGGSVAAGLDGTPFDADVKSVELTAEHRILSREVHWGTRRLEPGRHTLDLKALRPGAVGVDFLWIQRE